MFRFIAKSAVAAVIWGRYRRVIISTLVLFAGYLLITLFHSDYVDYAVNAGDTASLWSSYLIKWSALMGITVVYYLYNTRIFVSRRADKSHSPDPRDIDPVKPTGDATGDPFAEIRHKRRLNSHGDAALERYRRADD